MLIYANVSCARLDLTRWPLAGPGLLPLRAGLAHRGGQGIAAAARGGEIV